MKQFIVIILLTMSSLVHGQYHTAASRSELGILVGGSYYLGDLNQFSQFRNTHLAGGLVYRFNINPRVSFRANFTYAKVSAADSQAKNQFQRERNLSFSSEIYELGAGFR